MAYIAWLCGTKEIFLFMVVELEVCQIFSIMLWIFVMNLRVPMSRTKQGYKLLLGEMTMSY